MAGKFESKKSDFVFLFCTGCKYYFGNQACKAFPQKIPNNIFNAEREHLKPLPDQTGEFVFERAA
jgi:hypothetical protein